MELENRKVLVVGLGKTGIETVRFLINRGADVRASDINPIDKLPIEVKEFREKGIEIETDMHRMETFIWAETIVLSPGVTFNLLQIIQALNYGIEVISEVELASRFLKTPIIAITGSNGKTTTCSLITRILERDGRRVFLGGNIGTPLIQIVGSNIKFDVLVLELSSFQLQGIKSFKPFIGVLINISPNHLDHHQNLEEYIESKLKLFSNQSVEDWAVYNHDDPIVSSSISKFESKKIPFGMTPNENGVHYDGRYIGFGSDRYDISNMRLIGSHNVENCMAAIAATRIFGCNPGLIEDSIVEFSPLPHRIEFVREIRGARFYNDSKSTSPGATLRALESFSNPIILISGGKDKGLDYGVLRDKIKEKVKHLILVGESRFRMQNELGSIVDTSIVVSIEDALEKATLNLRSGDTVLFSPACSSFDMYVSYEERGRSFKDIVQKLPT
ncbi:MAG: UDP-N-acetylmuramoyl-L-alanine--D-glutamate ligase [Thermodesulfobacteriota bacterium]